MTKEMLHAQELSNWLNLPDFLSQYPNISKGKLYQILNEFDADDHAYSIHTKLGKRHYINAPLFISYLKSKQYEV